ncbi:hypothetical protein BJ878DRAFT_338336 [Calycina marina]|uniref:Autophagy-related protein n=1 Tax=Calycina marina TaxID=1763456 RepID=A0A9P7YVD0_9HELO|nr:hypothetical protein BJ878DRAFT_338336 [Calycina marina]
MGLYVVYCVITYILSAILCMYIPHCMRLAGEKEQDSQSSPQLLTSPTPSNTDLKTPTADEANMSTHDIEATIPPEKTTSRKYGFIMSIMGGVATSVGGVIALLLTIILTQTLPTDSSQTAGLLATTVIGFITIAGSIVGYFGLPIVPSKDTSHKSWVGWGLQVFTPFRDLLPR